MAPPLDRNMFMLDIGLVVEDEEWISLIAGSADTENCVGTFNYTVCTLKSAIGVWTVTVHDGVVSFVGSQQPTIVALANNTAPMPIPPSNSGDGYHSSTFGGIAALTFHLLDDVVATFVNDGGQVVPDQTGSAAYGYIKYEPAKVESRCWSYSDPYQDTLLRLNRLML